MDTEVVQGVTAGTTTGAQLTFSPKITFTSWTTYRFPFGLTIGGGARYTDSQFRNGNNTQSTVTNLAMNPDAWVIDAMAGYDVSERIVAAAERAEPDRQVLPRPASTTAARASCWARRVRSC